jgi:KaiC/GvpD/RAD55 family RecA-like ATPase
VALISSSLLFNPNEKPSKAEPIVKVGITTIATLGNVITMSGRPGVRKTTFLHSFLGAYLKNRPIHDLMIYPPDDNRRRIILLDTEQNSYSLYSQFQRLKNVTKIDKINPDLLTIYRLRSLNEEDVKAFIYTILDEHKDIFMLCIDNILDLVLDYNNIPEAKKLMDMIKSITDYYNIIIFAIIHQSKQTAFSIGHTGSRLEALSQTSMRVQYTKLNQKDDDKTISELIVGEKIRDAKEFEPIQITYDSVNECYKKI